MTDPATRSRRPSGRPAPKVRPEREGAIRVELVSIGRELLRGRIRDENACNVARFLTQRGADVRRVTVVDDDEREISAALREALGRNPHLVVTTGGLGPTDNDRTVAALADVLGLTMSVHAGAKALVGEAYRTLAERRLVPQSGLTAAREKICTLPVGSVPLRNPVGVSPGILLKLPGGAAVLSLPGMPDEVRAVLEQALPALGALAPKSAVARREIESPTADESTLIPLLERLCLEFPSLWIESHPAGSRRRGSRIVISVEASGTTQAEADRAVDQAVKRLLAIAAGGP